jgi:hypothetical protein
MGRPTNKKNFGSGNDRLSIRFHNGTALVNGFVVKQTGTNTFIVSDGTNQREIQITSNESLARRLMGLDDLTSWATISGVDNGSTVFIRKLTSHKAQLLSGAQRLWNLGTSVLGAIAIPTQIQATPALVNVAYATNYSAGGYNYYGMVFSDTTGQTRGVDYDVTAKVNPSTFPNQTTITWLNKAGVTPTAGVWGYDHIDAKLSANTSLVNLTSLTSTFNYSYTGSTNFNVLCEIWLGNSSTDTAWDGNNANTQWEVGFFLHAADYNFHNGGVAIGDVHVNNGVSYTVRRNNKFITFAPQNGQDVLSGTIDWRAAFDYLVFHNIITGSEWISGYLNLLGIEPTMKSGTGSYGGDFTINSLSYAGTIAPGFYSADYLGANYFSNQDSMTGWDLTGLTNNGFTSDPDGGNTAVVLMESTGTASDHSFIKSGATFTIDSRELDYVLFEDVKADKGRTKFQQYLAIGDFTSQLKTGFDVSTLTATNDTTIGTKLTANSIGRQIINLGNGYYRLITMFKKAAGITTLFYNFGIKDATGATNYVGDVTKGVTIRPRHRLIQSRKITLLGSPPSAVTGVPYSFTPTIIGGKSPLAFSAIGFPTGWAVNASTGELTNATPMTGSVTGTIRATGADGTVANLTVSLTVSSAPLTTFDDTSKGTSTTLSEGNRRMTSGANNMGARSTSSRSGEIVYAEFEVVSQADSVIGLVNNSSASSMSNWLAVNGIGIAPNGDVVAGGSGQGSAGLGTIGTGDVVGVELNKTTNKVEFSKNGVFSGVLYTIQSSAKWLAATGAPGFSVRLRTEAGQFTYAPRSGVSPWA